MKVKIADVRNASGVQWLVLDSVILPNEIKPGSTITAKLPNEETVNIRVHSSEPLAGGTFRVTFFPLKSAGPATAGTEIDLATQTNRAPRAARRTRIATAPTAPTSRDDFARVQAQMLARGAVLLERRERERAIKIQQLNEDLDVLGTLPPDTIATR